MLFQRVVEPFRGGTKLEKAGYLNREGKAGMASLVVNSPAHVLTLPLPHLSAA